MKDEYTIYEVIYKNITCWLVWNVEFAFLFSYRFWFIIYYLGGISRL